MDREVNDWNKKDTSYFYELLVFSLLVDRDWRSRLYIFTTYLLYLPLTLRQFALCFVFFCDVGTGQPPSIKQELFKFGDYAALLGVDTVTVSATPAFSVMDSLSHSCNNIIIL